MFGGAIARARQIPGWRRRRRERRARWDGYEVALADQAVALDRLRDDYAQLADAIAGLAYASPDDVGRVQALAEDALARADHAQAKAGDAIAEAQSLGADALGRADHASAKADDAIARVEALGADALARADHALAKAGDAIAEAQSLGADALARADHALERAGDAEAKAQSLGADALGRAEHASAKADDAIARAEALGADALARADHALAKAGDAIAEAQSLGADALGRADHASAKADDAIARVEAFGADAVARADHALAKAGDAIADAQSLGADAVARADHALERAGDAEAKAQSLGADALGRAEHATSVAREALLPARIAAFSAWLEMRPPVEGQLVSVVLPTRDRPALLPRAIVSVLLQRYERWQLVLVDDGDTDAVEIALASSDDERITFVEGPRCGLAAARNAGLERAEGEVVCYLDDDNVMHPSWLEAVAQVFAAREDVDVLYGVTLAEHRIPDVLDPVGWWPSFWQLPWSRQAALAQNPADAGALAHRRELEGARFDEDLSTGEDWDLLIRLTAEREALAVPALSHAYSIEGGDRMSRDSAHRAGLEEIRRRHAGG